MAKLKRGKASKDNDTGGEKVLIWELIQSLIIRIILHNQSVDTWTTHSRHLNGKITDVVAQRHNLMGSWQSP